MLDLKALLTKVLDVTKDLMNSKIVYGMNNSNQDTSFIVQWKSASVTSNSSGLINLQNAFGIDSNNAFNININCATSNYKIAGITSWNGIWYAILCPHNSATPIANKTVTLIVSWHRSGSRWGGVIESIKRFFTFLSSPKDWGWAMC